MKLKTAFALLVATMAIDSRFDVVASSSSILDGSDPQATRKTRSLTSKNANSCRTENAEIIELKKEIKTLRSSLNDGGGYGEVMYRDIKAVYHRPHWECGNASRGPNTRPDKEVTFIETQMKDDVDFIGLGEYEASNVIDASTRNFGMIGATCRFEQTEPIRLYYNKNYWNKVDSYPKSEACQNPQKPPGGSAVAPWKCGVEDVVPANTGEGVCCSCTYAADQANNGSTGPKVQDRAWVAGIFEYTFKYNENLTVCVVAAGMVHPYASKQWEGKTPQGTGTIGPKVTNFCGSHSIIFMADTNLIRSSERTRDLFNGGPLSDLRDSEEPTYTCCKNNGNTMASDRIAVTGTLVVEQITGGASGSGKTNWPADMGYQCEAEAEHLPIKATIAARNNGARIPKTELKCFPGSRYDDCLDGFYFNGDWVFAARKDSGYPKYIPNPKCNNIPESCEQFCNECAGGPANTGYMNKCYDLNHFGGLQHYICLPRK